MSEQQINMTLYIFFAGLFFLATILLKPLTGGLLLLLIPETVVQQIKPSAPLPEEKPMLSTIPVRRDFD